MGQPPNRKGTDMTNVWTRRVKGKAAIAVLVLVALAACTASKSPAGSSAGDAAAAPAGGPYAYETPAQSASQQSSAALKLLKTTPEKGNVGTAFTVTGESLPAGREVELVWATWDGSYVMKPTAETVEFYERLYEPKRVPFGRATINPDGRLSATFAAPDDYGEIHDIYAVIDGQDVAKAGFRIVRNVTITPTEGPVGTPITIKVDGLGWKPYEGTLSVLWDNNYSGFISAVATRGNTVGQIRAAGPIGKHVIQVGHASATVPYLNYEQSPVAHIPNFRFEFTVTQDAGAPPPVLDWPLDGLGTDGVVAAKTTVGSTSATSAAGVSTRISPASGPILSQTTLQAKDLPAEAELNLLWVTAVGNRVSPSGWSLREVPLGKARTDKNGALEATVQVPDDLGGWHSVKLVQNETVLAEVAYFVERSLVAVTPPRVKAGETFTVQIKGIGWTELDNGVAVTYDNAYIGYACGFNSQGDVTMSLVATGGAGTHLIDLYPMIYQGHGKPPWAYQTSILSYKQDAPGLALGYRLPAFRLAITIVE